MAATFRPSLLHLYVHWNQSLLTASLSTLSPSFSHNTASIMASTTYEDSSTDVSDSSTDVSDNADIAGIIIPKTKWRPVTITLVRKFER
jgi:hypothetical protein